MGCFALGKIEQDRAINLCIEASGGPEKVSGSHCIPSMHKAIVRSRGESVSSSEAFVH